MGHLYSTDNSWLGSKTAYRASRQCGMILCYVRTHDPVCIRVPFIIYKPCFECQCTMIHSACTMIYIFYTYTSHLHEQPHLHRQTNPSTLSRRIHMRRWHTLFLTCKQMKHDSTCTPISTYWCRSSIHSCQLVM